MEIMYIDLSCGVSGEMLLGAFVDVGVNQQYLISELRKLTISDQYEISFEMANKCGVMAKRVIITTRNAESLHWNLNKLDDVLKVIDSSSLNSTVKKLSKTIYVRLAQSQAKVQGVNTEDVFLGEVGSIASFIKIIGCSICIDYLEVDNIICSAINAGSGAFCNGIQPDSLELLRGIPIYTSDVRQQLATSVGIGIITSVADSYGIIPAMKIKSIGYGAGELDLSYPNCVRIIIGDSVNLKSDSVCLLESNIDSITGEAFGYIIERLFELGANDVWYTPIFMNKNRPAYMLSVLCNPKDMQFIKSELFIVAGTQEIRKTMIDRDTLPPSIKNINTKYGNVRVKISNYGDVEKRSPEYEDCKIIAEKHNRPIAEIMDEVRTEYKNIYGLK